jgi:hypothetical protein
MPGIRDTAYPQLKSTPSAKGVGGGLHSKFRGTGLGGEANEGEDAACWSSRLNLGYVTWNALPERNNFSRLWVRQISFHSARTFCNPRKRNRRIPRFAITGQSLERLERVGGVPDGELRPSGPPQWHRNRGKNAPER